MSAVTGAGQPLGILNSAALITVDKDTSPAQPTGISLTNMATMIGRLAPGSFANSTWLVHPTAMAQLVVLQSISAPFQSPIVLHADGTLTAFTRPVVVTEACSPLDDVGDIILADLSQYVIGLRRDVRIEIAREAYFATDEIGFRLTIRTDGQPAASSATTLRDGVSTTFAIRRGGSTLNTGSGFRQPCRPSWLPAARSRSRAGAGGLDAPSPSDMGRGRCEFPFHCTPKREFHMCSACPGGSSAVAIGPTAPHSGHSTVARST